MGSRDSAIAGSIGIGLCVGWLVAPTIDGRGRVFALAAVLAVCAEALLIAGAAAGIACGAAALAAGAAHSAWRRRLA